MIFIRQNIPRYILAWWNMFACYTRKNTFCGAVVIATTSKMLRGCHDFLSMVTKSEHSEVKTHDSLQRPICQTVLLHSDLLEKSDLYRQS